MMPESAESFRATHTVPEQGLAIWDRPDPALAETAWLTAEQRVCVLEQQPNGWARVSCSNGWHGWVDGRQLKPLRLPTPPRRSATTVQTPSPTPEQRQPAEPKQAPELSDEELDPVVARLRLATDELGRHLQQLQEGTLDMADFRRLAVRSGIVEQDGTAWILDLANGRWMIYDGIGLVPSDLAAKMAAGIDEHRAQPTQQVPARPAEGSEG